MSRRWAHLLPAQQQVLVDAGSQEAGVAVAFHQLEDVLLEQRREEVAGSVRVCV